MKSYSDLKRIKDFDWINWNPIDLAVLVFVMDGNNVLLIHKKRGLGKGKINGPGGRLEKGESYEEAAIREVKEETHLEIKDLEETAELSFVFTNGHSIHAKVFLAHSYQGVPTETEEADPFWHPYSNLPYEKMWQDDYLWLPPVFEGHYTTGKFIFDEDEMLDYKVILEPRLTKTNFIRKGPASL